jgi:hypothetical protein
MTISNVVLVVQGQWTRVVVLQLEPNHSGFFVLAYFSEIAFRLDGGELVSSVVLR